MQASEGVNIPRNWLFIELQAVTAERVITCVMSNESSRDELRLNAKTIVCVYYNPNSAWGGMGWAFDARANFEQLAISDNLR